MSKIFIQLILMSMLIQTNLIAQNNPFNTKYETPHETPPFNKIKMEHFVPAFDKGIKDHQSEIDLIVNNQAAPTFQNTIEAMENAGELLDKVSSV